MVKEGTLTWTKIFDEQKFFIRFTLNDSYDTRKTKQELQNHCVSEVIKCFNGLCRDDSESANYIDAMWLPERVQPVISMMKAFLVNPNIFHQKTQMVSCDDKVLIQYHFR